MPLLFFFPPAQFFQKSMMKGYNNHFYWDDFIYGWRWPHHFQWTDINQYFICISSQRPLNWKRHNFISHLVKPFVSLRFLLDSLNIQSPFPLILKFRIQSYNVWWPFILSRKFIKNFKFLACLILPILNYLLMLWPTLLYTCFARQRILVKDLTIQLWYWISLKYTPEPVVTSLCINFYWPLCIVVYSFVGCFLIW